MKTKSAKYNEITPLQVFFLLFLSQLGAGLLTLPRDVIESAGQDGWLSVILATVLNMIMVAVAVKLALRFKGLSLIEINEKIFGRFLGFIVSLAYFSYFLLNASFLLRIATGLVTVWVLPYTNPLLTNIFYLLSLIYFTRNGIKIIARVYNLYFYHLIPLFLVIIWPALRFEPRLFFPIGTQGLIPVLKGMEGAVYSLLGFESILLLNPFLKEPKKTMLPAQLATALAGLIYTVTVVILIGYFGIGELKFQLWPTIYVSRTIKVAFLERLDIIIDIVWIIVIFTSMAMSYYLSSLSLTKILKRKEHKLFTILIAFPVFLLNYFMKDVAQYYGLVRYLNLLGIVLAYFLPLVMYVIAAIKKRKGGREIA